MAKFSKEQTDEWHEEGLKINKLVDEIIEKDKLISPQQAAEIVVAEKKFENLDEETQKNFGKGWGEEMQRQIIALHPAVKKVEQAPAYSDYEEKADAFVDFDKGPIAVQLTLNGYAESGKKDLNEKFNDLLKEKFGNVNYYDRKELPLTMSRGTLGEFVRAYDAWKEHGQKGSPIEFMGINRRDDLANEFVMMMSRVFEWKYIKLGKKEFKEWADYLKDVYEKRARELKEKRAAALKHGRIPVATPAKKI